MRVLLVAQSLYGDGIGSVTFNIHRALKRKGIESDIACFSDFSENDIHIRTVRNSGSDVYHIDRMKKSGIVGYMRSIEKICKNKNYDVIHIHTGLFAWITALPAKKSGVRMRIAHAHGQKTSLPFFLEWIIKRPFQFLNRQLCNALIGCTETSNVFAYGNKGTVIRNFILEDSVTGVPKDEIKKIREWLNSENPNSIVFCFMGNINQNKNVIFLPDVMYHLHKNGINAMLLIAGKGVMEAKVAERIKELEISKYVKMLGKRNDCSILLQASDLYISSSFSEGMSMSMVEAQMCGKTCIVSEDVSDDSNLGLGLFYRIKTRDASMWADSICEILKVQIKMSPEEAIEKMKVLNEGEDSIIESLIRIYEGQYE